MSKIFLIVIITLALSTNIYAECENYEYAELKDMTEEQIRTAYGENQKEQDRLLSVAKGSGSMATMNKIDTLMKECFNSSKEMRRIFEKRFPDSKLVDK